MRLMNIASGSAGNATYAGTDNTHILIDSGVSRKRITEGLKKLGLTLYDLTAILLTHEHSDHISSLGVVERTVSIPVYTTAGTAQGVISSGCLKGMNDIFIPIKHDSVFTIGDLTIKAISTSHDARDPVCYRISHEHSDCAVVTDLGVYDEYMVESLKGLSAIILEANHDIRMLETGPYPYNLKMRVAGNKGHLSNETSGRFLSELLHDDLKHIALGHISQKNNLADLALLTVSAELDQADNCYRASDFRIDAADQLTGTQIYEF